jgi:large subunit ribosomal protein L2
MLKKFKPYNSSLRNTILYKKNNLTKIKKDKNLIFSKKNNAGRNNNGHFTAPRKGKRNKILKRRLDYSKLNFTKKLYIIESIEYDPNRSALIMRVFSKISKKK